MAKRFKYDEADYTCKLRNCICSWLDLHDFHPNVCRSVGLDCHYFLLRVLRVFSLLNILKVVGLQSAVLGKRRE